MRARKPFGLAWLICAAVMTTGLALSPRHAAAAGLEADVERRVEQGFEDPQGALAALRILQATVAPTPDNRRLVLVGMGLVAADNHLRPESAASARALEELAKTSGPIAAADAHLVRADFDFDGSQEETGNVEARAAVAGYAPACESTDPPTLALCDPFNWFHALIYAGYGAQGERNPAAAAIYVHMALETARQAGNRAQETKATAILASLAQNDNDGDLADRLIARAQSLAKLEGDPSLFAFVQSFIGDILARREEFAAARAAYAQAVTLAHAAGLARRQAQAEIALADAELSLDHPADALLAIQKAGPFLATHTEPGLERQRLHISTIALLSLGRVAEAKVKLHEVLGRYDRETGPNARIEALRELGPALAKAGDRDGALDLFTREQALLLAKSGGRYERDMLDVQKLIKDEGDKLQARRLEQWGTAAAICVLLALVIAAIARRQIDRNRQLALRNDALRLQAEHDPLTGLANRAHLQPRLDAQSSGGTFDGALFLIDIDHFKRVNDCYGHAGGDAVLVDIARRLGTVLRGHDLVVRWGGEEFLVLVETIPPHEAVALARRLLRCFGDAPVMFEGQAIAVTASIGFAVFPLQGVEPTRAFDLAFGLVDAAMYFSKRHGRNCATSIEHLDATLALDLGSLATTLERAAEQGNATLRIYRHGDAQPAAAPMDRVSEPVAEVPVTPPF